MITISDKEFKQLTGYIKTNYGIHLKEEKKALVIGRLYTVLEQSGFKNFTEYYEAVTTDRTGETSIKLVDRITTNHTFFMREADHFFFFRDKVLPYLSKTVRDKDLNIWCAACSSGEEAYTLAMIMDEFFGRDKVLWNTKLLATDISENVLNTAKTGQYPNVRLAPLPQNWRINYFKKVDTENSAVTDRIRNEVIFRKFNLMNTTFPFRRKFHAIFCRNVMIYFDNETKAELINRFYDHMEYGGYLFVGHSESLNREQTKFRYIMPAVYRKE